MRDLLTRLDAGVGRLLALLDRRPPLGAVAILLVGLVTLLPGQAALPVIDRDEARYVLASQQMLASGDLVDIRNLDRPRYKKPVGIYWSQAAVAAIDGRGAEAPIDVFRRVSVAGILLAGLMTLWAFAPLVGGAAATLAGVGVTSAAMSIVEAHIAKTDALLLGVTMLALAAILRSRHAFLNAGPVAARWLLWAALAAGVLIKGPITPLVAALAMAAFCLRDRSLRFAAALAPARGAALFLALTLPWFVAITIASDGAFWAASFGEDLMGKVGSGAEGHAGPPGYYLATVWVTFWPWAPFALLAVPGLWRDRRAELPRLLALWIGGVFLLFELLATKLPHYTLPALPAVALMAALAIAGQRRVPALWLRIVAAALLLAGAAALAGLIAFAPALAGAAPDGPALLAAALALLLTVAAAGAIAAGGARAALVPALAAAMLLTPALLTRSIPAMTLLFPSEKMSALDAQLDVCAVRPAVSVGYAELSLAVLTGPDTLFPSRDRALALLARRDGWRVFVTDTGDAPAAGFVGQSQVALQEIARFPLINYNQSQATRTAVLLAAANDPRLAPCLPLGG